MNLLSTKTILKTCLNTRETLKFLLLKIFFKNTKQWGIYSPKTKLAVRLIWQPDRLAVDRPVDRQRSYFWPLGKPGRPPGRPKQTESSALGSGRPPGRPRLCLPDVHKSVHVGQPQGSAGPWCGRPFRSTDLACQHRSGSETLVRNIFENLFKSRKNTQK